MVDFGSLPNRIQQIAKAELQSDEQICLCVLGRSSLLHPDFVLITNRRVLILDEKYIGSLAVSYANVRCNLPFTEINTVNLARFLKHRILGQARLEINVKRNMYCIDNMSYREARRAHTLIAQQIQN